MKSLFFSVVALVLLFCGVPGRAADGRVFEGIRLDEVGRMRQLRDMPEIYERDPESGGRRYRLRKAVVQIPLGKAWITFNAERDVFYLNRVPGEPDADYFGPVTGDVFEQFKLEERFIAALREDSGAGDVPNRLDLMLRTGHRKLRERALRVMTAGLAPDISAATRASHLGKFKEVALGLDGEDVAPLRAAITATERRIDELTLTLPDTDYGPGNEELARQGRLQEWMKVGVPVPDAAWGAPMGGLRAAAVFSSTRPAPGEKVTVWLLAENTSDREIRFGCSDVMQSARPRVTRGDGKEAQVRSTWYSGMSPILRYRLQPRERVTLARKTLVFSDAAGAADAGFGGDRIVAGPGEYRVRYDYVLITGSAWSRGDDGEMHRTFPAKGEWSGHVGTADTVLTVPGPAAAVEPGVLPVPAAAPRAERTKTGTQGIRIRVLDPDGQPVPEFQILAGIKPGVSAPADVVTWQPHTVRTGFEGEYIWPFARSYDPMALRIEAEGFGPHKFAWLEKGKSRELECRLARDAGLVGRVVLPDGRPAAGAVVALAMVQRDAVLENGRLRHAGQPLPDKPSDQWRWPRFVTADDQGRFRLPPENDPTAALLVVHDQGVRELSLASFRAAADGVPGEPGPESLVQLQSWGRIAGRAKWGIQSGDRRAVSLIIHRDSYGYPGVIAQYEKTTTDADGNFVFERVLPGLTQVSCTVPVPPGQGTGVTEVHLPGMLTHLTVQPGGNVVCLGGEGRTVTGRLTGCEAPAEVTFHFHPTAPRSGWGSDFGMWGAWNALREGPLGTNFFRGGLKVRADGAFEVGSVLPGDYQIFFTRAGSQEHASGKFVVPAENPGLAPEPLDIGEFRCRPRP